MVPSLVDRFDPQREIRHRHGTLPTPRFRSTDRPSLLSCGSPNLSHIALLGEALEVVNNKTGRVVHLELHPMANVDVHDVGPRDGAGPRGKSTSVTFESIPHQFVVLAY